MPATNISSRSSDYSGPPNRRAKSTSSAQSTPRRQMRPPLPSPRSSYRGCPNLSHISTDPFIARQQAETAALEAYARAQAAKQEVPLGDYRPAPAQLERRRSRISGRTEGGHFEDARLGRRKSRSGKAGEGHSNGRVRNASQRRSEIEPQSVPAKANEVGEVTVVRKRSLVMPSSGPKLSSSHVDHTVPSADAQGRRSVGGDANGSPMPCQQPSRESRGRSYGDGSDHLDTSHRAGVATDTLGLSRPRAQPEAVAVDQARDQCLQGFQQRKLRERKSMLLAPLQKRKAATQTSSTGGFDTSLPPFNHAEEGLHYPPSAPPPPPPSMLPSQIPTHTVPEAEKKSRHFSGSLKDKFKKVFRKSSRVPSRVPAQHVEGRTFHFSTATPSSKSRVSATQPEDPFSIASDGTTMPENRTPSAISRHTDNKSRATSWTNSTVTGTTSTRNGTASYADENGRLHRSDSVSTLRKAKSFFGRPSLNNLRRPSKAQLQSSEESAGLYNALKERIDPSDSASQVPARDSVSSYEESSALATLPSQQRRDSTEFSKPAYAAQTIRSVTPDVTAWKLNIPSPVTEVMSPVEAPVAAYKFPASDHTPGSQLKRRPAMKALIPSQEQLARRMERSKNRWQAPLDEMVPGVKEDNPYELRSLSRSLPAPIVTSDLPHHARVERDTDSRAENVLSPSIYSRASDGASPRRDTPVEPSGMMITITGREVRSFSISPQKRQARAEEPVYTHKEWRRWLSDEMRNWGDKTVAIGESIHQQPVQSERLSSSSPSSGLALTEPKRPRERSSRSSFMNERYPMIETVRQSSDTRTISSKPVSRAGSAEPDLMMSGALVITDTGMEAGEDTRPQSVVHRPRTVSKYQSMAEMRHIQGQMLGTLRDADQRESSVSEEPLQSIENNEETKVPNKHKSAFDLRANYKACRNGQYRNVTAYQRKAEPTHQHTASSPIHILEDTTIQNISAGPYASQQLSSPAAFPADANKENSPPPQPSLEVSNLPALSSSEWLATSTNKSKSRQTSGAANALRERRVSRYSPTRAVSTAPNAFSNGGGSPGQRMVTSWLDGKRSKENSPAFI